MGKVHKYKNMLYIPVYQLIRLDRRWTNCCGNIEKVGGVCCYIDSNIRLSHLELNHLNYSY